MSINSLDERIHALEQRLLSQEPLGSSHDMPFAIFAYRPEQELKLRREVDLLTTRLRNAGSTTEVVDLGEVMWECFAAHPAGADGLTMAEEAAADLDAVLREAKTLLAGPRADQAGPLELRVIERLSRLSSERDIGLLVRAGELFPLYRTSALLERLMGQITMRTVLFYPGTVESPSSLRFMGIGEPSPRYRVTIFS